METRQEQAEISGTAGAGNNVGNAQLQPVSTSHGTTTRLHILLCGAF